MAVLGISAYYHDSAAALVDDGGCIVAAAQEERFTRRRHDPAFPEHAIGYCLAAAGIGLADLESVVFYEQPLVKLGRIVDGWLTHGRHGRDSYLRAAPKWIFGGHARAEPVVEALGRLERGVPWRDRLVFTEHHAAHAASAFFPSPFEDAAVLTVDGVGERATTALWRGRGNTIEKLGELHFPHSLGLLYSAFTYFLGFKVNSGEYKVMGLAPYGEPVLAETIRRHLLSLDDDGTFTVEPSFFDHFSGVRIANRRFEDLFGVAPRTPEEPLRQCHMDLAASVQQVLEEAMLGLARAAAGETGARNLCLAGGVALNCVANGRIQRDGPFENIWIQPAAGDAGGAFGAALFAHHVVAGHPRRTLDGAEDAMSGAFLGPSFDDDKIAADLSRLGADYDRSGGSQLLDRVADDIALGRTVGWFQGRMEFGPRALGARSILASPRDPAMQRTLNLKVKKRESFRPFAPAVLAEHASEWFELGGASPYMLLVAEVADGQRLDDGSADARVGLDRLAAPRSTIPAVTHVDGSARIQTVQRKTNPLFHALLARVHRRTGCPVVVNTSFNVRGETIVCTPEDAFRSFMNTELDVLAIGSFYLERRRQDRLVELSLKQTFPDD